MASRSRKEARTEGEAVSSQQSQPRECARHEPVRVDVITEARLGFQTWKLYRVACRYCGKDMGTETELG
jgi:hypothetical protein